MMKKKFGKSMLTAAGAVCACVFVLAQPLSVFAATGTVTSSNVKVRAEASTTSEQVSSLDTGDTVDIIDEATDSQGYVWYRIYVNGQEFGYVRSDLVSKSGSTTSSNTQASATLPETQVTALESQGATVTVASANVRSGAGTAYTTVGTVKNGEAVTVTGEANGTDSKKWYQISFGSSGRTGFVRADLVQIGVVSTEVAETTDASAEGGEGENPEATGEEQPVEGAEGETGEVAPAPEEQPAAPAVIGNGEFSLDYKDDGTGNEVWYLYDNVESTQVKLDDLLSFATAGQKTGALETQVKKLKMALIIMACVIAALVFAVLLLIYKLRDYMYYEDEEEEEEEIKGRSYEKVTPQKPAKKAEEKPSYKSMGRTVADSKDRGEVVTPRREPKGAPMGTAESLMGNRKKPSFDDEPEVRQPKADRAPSRKSRNFLMDDDEFEFEFLDLDDEEK